MGIDWSGRAAGIMRLAARTLARGPGEPRATLVVRMPH